MPGQQSAQQNPYLVQMLLAPAFRRIQCEATDHHRDQIIPPVRWRARFYENFALVRHYLAEGLEKEQALAALWDGLSREQDTIGLQCRLSQFLCQDCVMVLAQAQLRVRRETSGAVEAITRMMNTPGVLLFLADRQTRFTYLASYPQTLDDEEVLPMLREARRDLALYLLEEET